MLKKIHFLEDSTGERYALHYVRERNQHEVDFFIVKSRKPFLLIECKVKDKNQSPFLRYYMEKFNLDKSLQLTMNSVPKETKNNITVMSAYDFLSEDMSLDFVF